MLKPLTLIIILFLSLITQAQKATDNPTLPKLDIYKGAEEKKLLSSIASGEDFDFLTLFLISDSSSYASLSTNNLSSRLNEFVSSEGYLENHDYKSKDLKKIYKDVHDAFLTKYVDNPSFGQLFIDGNYNCATATALYALLLDKLKINYSIRQTPVHVYIVAEPATLNILFETTAPGSKPVEITEKSKAAYVTYLYNNKLISKEEYNSDDKNELFEKHFYSDELIDKKKLAGLLYYNRGVEAMTEEHYNEAYKNFEKASFLYPDKKITYFTFLCLANIILDKGMAENEDALPYFIRFSELAKGESEKDVMIDYMDKVTQKLLFKFPDAQKYKTLYNNVCQSVTDSALISKIKYNHYYNTAHYYSIKNKSDSSLLYLDSVYAYNKSDLLIQELITGSIEEKMRTAIGNEETALTSLEQYFEVYPFIDKNSRLGEFYVYCISKVMTTKFKNDKNKEGEKYLATLQNLLSKQPELIPKVQVYAVPAFLEVYYYQLRQRQYKEAKTYLQSLNKFYADNEEIKSRMQRIDDLIQNQKALSGAKIIN